MGLPPPQLAVSRRTVPVLLDGATAFGEERPGFLDELNTASRISGYGTFAQLMDDRVLVKINNGRPRDPGRHWMAYMCWLGKEPSLLPWYNKMTPGFWKACGFKKPPSYKIVWQRFRELERFEEHFRWATKHFMDAARRRDPRIGAFVYVDGTEVRSHAQPRYDGPAKPGMKRPKRAPRFRILSTDDARFRRQEENGLPADEIQTTKASRTLLPGGGQRFRSGDHCWISRDPDAGLRAYGDTTYWYGYYHHKVVDMATGAVICVDVHPADENEAKAFPRVYGRAVEVIGADPVAVVGDRGYSVDAVYEFLTGRGVTGVFPWRRRNQNDPLSAPAGANWDAHGVPTCRHCGASGNYDRFNEKVGGGKIWFDCSNPITPGCNKTQTIHCSRNWSRLLPIWRTSPTYGLLMEHGQQYERVHKQHRERFRSGGKHFIERVRMMGQSCLQLRATAACAIEWLLVLDRQGWLTPGQTERAELEPMQSKGAFGRIMDRRRKEHLRGGEWRPHQAPPRRKRARSPVRTR